jgi:hypothetical protein
MYRTIVGALIFLLTLFVGIQTAAFVTDVTAQFSLPAEIPEPGSNERNYRFAKAPAGIRISYIGVNDSTLRFLIYNGSTEKVSCWGYSGICASPEIRINGLDANAWVCMNGSDNYVILPGDTAEMMVSPDDFARVPGKNEKVMVGYQSIDVERQEHHFAQPMVLPPAFRNDIRKFLSKRDE